MKCPRCGNEHHGAFYGPCQTCRDELNAKYYKEPVARAVSEAYTPKMNVTPNAVALKEERDDDPAALGEANGYGGIEDGEPF